LVGEPLYFGMVALSLGIAAESWVVRVEAWLAINAAFSSAPDTRPARLLPCGSIRHQ
jgi:hypothetical protein